MKVLPMEEERPEFAPLFLWDAYVNSAGDEKIIYSRLFFEPGIEYAWREVNKRCESSNYLCEVIILIITGKKQLYAQREYSHEMTTLAKKAREVAVLMDMIESRYGYAFSDLQLFSYMQADLMYEHIKNSPKYSDYEPQYKQVKISEHLQLLSEFASGVSEANAFSLNVSNRGNPQRVYIIRELSLALSITCGSVLRRTCARFASAVFGQAVSIDQVNDALKRFDGYN